MDSAQDYTALIDGYNVIRPQANWSPHQFAAARSRLIELLGQIRWPVPVVRIVVVFDAPDLHPKTLEWSSRLQVCFVGPSADSHIQETLRTSSSAQRFLVVSDDREILNTAKSHRALRYSVQWLLERRRPSSARTHGEKSDRHTSCEKPSLASARQITEELAKRWLSPP